MILGSFGLPVPGEAFLTAQFTAVMVPLLGSAVSASAHHRAA